MHGPFLLTCLETELQSPSSTIQEGIQTPTRGSSSQHSHAGEFKSPKDTAEEWQIEWNPRTITWENVYFSSSQRPLWLFSCLIKISVYFNDAKKSSEYRTQEDDALWCQLNVRNGSPIRKCGRNINSFQQDWNICPNILVTWNREIGY